MAEPVRRFQILSGETPVGMIEADPAFRLMLVSSETAERARLEEAVEILNGRATLELRVPPGPGESPFAIVTQAVARDSIDAERALIEMFRRKFGLDLTAS